FESYDMQKAIDPIVDFIDALNNWFIRRSRRRFWRSENDGDKVGAYAVLYRVLRRLALALAPIAPFVSEAMWQNLRRDGDADSVHLAAYPEYDQSYRDEDLEWKMAAVRKAVSTGRALRYQHELKIRQPLATVQLVTRDSRERAVLLEMEDIIRDELNVKEVVFRDDEEELVRYTAKANFRVLGKELGKDMKEGAAIIEKLSGRQIAGLLEGSSLVIEVAGRSIEISASKVDIRREEREGLRVLNEGTLTVALDAEISQELLDEGNARDLVRGVQTLRKDSGFAVTDRINLSVHGNDVLQRAWNAFSEFVAAETLASTVEWELKPDMTAIDAGNETWKVALRKA
ncbi:MAG: isoleucine--tRNA ligase, partial [Spirochaetales bacterium]